jgi:hypothetical protein
MGSSCRTSRDLWARLALIPQGLRKVQLGRQPQPTLGEAF